MGLNEKPSPSPCHLHNPPSYLPQSVNAVNNTRHVLSFIDVGCLWIKNLKIEHSLSEGDKYLCVVLAFEGFSVEFFSCCYTFQALITVIH